MSNLIGAGSTEAELGKGAAIPALIVGIIGLIASSIAKGLSGFYGALLAQGVVIIFFAVHLLISRAARKMDPTTVMVLAMLSYFVKILVLGALFLLVLINVSATTLNRTCFGSVAIAVIIAWLSGEVRAFFKLRMQMPLPPQSSSSSATGTSIAGDK